MGRTLLTMDAGGFYLNGEPFDLASGDFHYYRTLPGGWGHRLKLMKAFGLNTLQTYVPWNLHEPEKGHYHFDGHLNLRAFLEACQAEGLYVMLRPSPYICSECEYESAKWLGKCPSCGAWNSFVEDVVEAWAAVYEPSATPEEPGETKDITVTFDKPTTLQIDGETVLNVTTYSAHAYKIPVPAENETVNA